MLKLSMVILFCCVMTGCVVAQPTQKYNLDFEQLDAHGNPKDWKLGRDKTTNVFTIDSTVKQRGKYALKINWKSSYGEYASVTYGIKDAFKGKKITLTGYIKTENLGGNGAALWMSINSEDKMLAFDNMDGRQIKGTTDWQPYSITLDYDGQEASKIVFGALVEGEGKMWVDNLSLSIDGVDISKATPLPKAKASLDTAYQYGSSISSIPLSDEKIKELTNLGMLWGFIKYHHANVSKGDYNMDAELFRILPKIMAAKDCNEANALMEQWTDRFGKPDICNSCKDFSKTALTVQAPDYGYLFAKNNFPQTLMDKLAYIKHNVDTGNNHYYIKFAEGAGQGHPTFTHEIAYTQNAYPDAGTRLLALYRYWNIVQYFYPYKHLTGEDWNKVLETSIPEFVNAKDTSAYVMACLHLIAHIHDTHGGIWDAGNLSYIKGSLMTPFMARFIENKLVVTGYYKDTLDIKNKVHIGDVIEKIDGTPIGELVKRYLPTTPASNYETQLRDMPQTLGFLLTSNDPTVRLQIKRDGKLSDISVPRIKGDMSMIVMDVRPGTDAVAYKLLPGNIGYIYPGSLKEGDLENIKDSLGKTQGIIIDMRCYPATFMSYTYGEWLKSKPSPFARVATTNTQIPGDFELQPESLENGIENKNNYKGKLVIIVNTQTQSLGEFTAMALATVPGAVVIGSTTAGADGDIAEIKLPGGVNTEFSGIGILYPDGTESQRKGVKIDKVVEPTIEGIKAGRDELMEAAIKIIKG